MMCFALCSASTRYLLTCGLLELVPVLVTQVRRLASPVLRPGPALRWCHVLTSFFTGPPRSCRIPVFSSDPGKCTWAEAPGECWLGSQQIASLCLPSVFLTYLINLAVCSLVSAKTDGLGVLSLHLTLHVLNR